MLLECDHMNSVPGELLKDPLAGRPRRQVCSGELGGYLKAVRLGRKPSMVAALRCSLPLPSSRRGGTSVRPEWSIWGLIDSPASAGCRKSDPRRLSRWQTRGRCNCRRANIVTIRPLTVIDYPGARRSTSLGRLPNGPAQEIFPSGY